MPKDPETDCPPAMMPVLHHFALLDTLRRGQGRMLEAAGFGPEEADYRIVAAGPHWRLRDYAPHRGRPSVLIVAAPIKRPYIWDLVPSASAIRFLLRKGLRVFLLEWGLPEPGRPGAGLDDCAGQAIPACVEETVSRSDGQKPVLMGHSLGGTLAVIAAALHPQSVRALVLVGTPLCFRPGISQFGDALVSLVPPTLFQLDVVPGSLVSHVAALASPETFLWSRMLDAATSLGDTGALEVQTRIERWTLDEAPLPGRLVHEIVEQLYREDRLYRGTLSVGGAAVRAHDLQLPVLAVNNTADDIAPPASVRAFFDASPARTRVIEFGPEQGIGMQHLAILAGPRAHARIWPEIVSWIDAQCPGYSVRQPGPARAGG